MLEADELTLDAFEKTMHDLYENLQQFTITLDAERALLEKNKPDELEASIGTKQLIIESLDKISFQFQSYLGSAANTFTDNGMQRILSQFPANKQLYLRDLWQQIKFLLKTCDKKNLVNGVMITTLKNYNENMLGIITNRPKEAVYGNQYKKSQLAVSTREHKA